ncbi:GntR family transcriptional regulator [Bacillus paralicheniformis]|jgi:DNA-binding GntR family transcriptional regulator|uniref:Transcriptional regulator GntR family n=1 Tax=Bacillus paralicheniformis TaxID=1648923 RepID=A0A6N2GTG9_9BACI|nr:MULTISPECIES: GntR family transcriptional regulator [Bacillus]KJD54928.1 GntR family transcriptional regulator [Bacillus amyloliquefaciens]KUL13679.1 GntR family transcriptional regulator [Bacillus licheniformis LMG 7559]POO78691.1 GntR family transcriptional regulator [Bacillus sp. MBGLi97]AGN37887.1 putative transcriptional regulator [Bacillus paralicheniformis ATCC 9945a]ARA87180.1 GntR family transcriptional regulator [Bacillus paralicheniformis]
MPIPKNYTPQVRLSAKEKAFHQLQRWIVDGTLEPGEKVTDVDLAEALGVSRTPVREALQLLESQGFVEMKPGKETKITLIHPDDALAVYPPLAHLQALAAELATPLLTEEEIAELKKLAAQYEAAFKEERNHDAAELDEQFHHLIIEAAKNPYVLQFSAVLQLHVRRMKYVFFNRPSAPKLQSAAEHWEIIAAFEKNDPKLAAEVMKKNWLRPMEDIHKILKDKEQ